MIFVGVLSIYNTGKREKGQWICDPVTLPSGILKLHFEEIHTIISSKPKRREILSGQSAGRTQGNPEEDIWPGMNERNRKEHADGTLIL